MKLAPGEARHRWFPVAWAADAGAVACTGAGGAWGRPLTPSTAATLAGCTCNEEENGVMKDLAKLLIQGGRQ